MKYPVLKIQQFDLSKVGLPDQLEVLFNNPYLVVSLICPEVDKSLQSYIDFKNLKPYELACKEFNGADYLYSKLYVNDAGKRVFRGFSGLYPALVSPTLTVIVSYLEFDKS
ncbi:hypothetical protein DBR40_19880 [Pedobacter sp. KBW01]|uniref:hypothetical protein n=1 Tax=Pedobacter sp. KBW01 TaxID=2153364 RepID=UPI000F5A088C|nr:hypothetical protein [Pedobacter sp. KBW01]RQO68503.1 hypothetical protein DBR40_19880 [Pedobacter sp. KBW01]